MKCYGPSYRLYSAYKHAKWLKEQIDNPDEWTDVPVVKRSLKYTILDIIRLEFKLNGRCPIHQEGWTITTRAPGFCACAALFASS